VIQQALQNDMLSIQQWLTVNKFTLNVTKTECILVGSRKVSRADPLVIRSDDQLLVVDRFKYLEFGYTQH
jgi:hypothetical protein